MSSQRIWEEWKELLGVKDSATLADLWEDLQDRGYVEEAACSRMDARDLADYSKLTLKSWRRREGRVPAKSRDTDKKEILGWLREDELERKAALEVYLAKYAACDADIFRFRKEVLDGEVLAKRQAWKLLRSPAAAYLRKLHFKGYNIPIVEHTARVEDTTPPMSGYSEGYSATVEVDPPGGEPIDVQMPFNALPGTKRDQQPVLIGFPDEQNEIESRRVWVISLLGELWDLGEKLASRYRWQPAQAVWFVLTGEVPAIVPLRYTQTFYQSNYHRDPTTTIEAATWLSVDTIRRAFLHAQAGPLGSGGRSPSIKNSRLFRFVMERVDSMGHFGEGKRPDEAPEYLRESELISQGWYTKIPKGKELVKEWNRTYPEWSYVIKTGDKAGSLDTRRFWRDYNRAKKKVVGRA